LSGALPGFAQSGATAQPMKHVLAIGDVQTGFQHDSVSHALATMERLGRSTGLFALTIRTDTQLITKAKAPAGVGNFKNLDTFDAVFFFGVGEGSLTDAQKADLLAFVHEDGKGFVAAHTGIDAFYHWPQYGEMVGGYFDQHPWGVTDGTVLVERPEFPGWHDLPREFTIRDEFYQTKAPYDRTKVDVIARLDTSKLDMTVKNMHRADHDFPVAWAKTYGKGRVFWSTFGHPVEAWDDPRVQRIYMGAMRWALGMESYTPAPHGMPG
jgi:type 1 glutamine amidotransferase